MHAEDVCVRCGRCCMVKERLTSGRVVLLGTHCVFYDAKTHLCKVYGKRHDQVQMQGHKCLTIEQAVTMGVLPVDCPYVAGLNNYTCDVPYPPRVKLEDTTAAHFAKNGAT